MRGVCGCGLGDLNIVGIIYGGGGIGWVGRGEWVVISGWWGGIDLTSLDQR